MLVIHVHRSASEFGQVRLKSKDTPLTRYKNRKKGKHKRKKKHTQQGMKLIFAILLKVGEQDWFQLLFMCARFESSTVNRTNLLTFMTSMIL